MMNKIVLIVCALLLGFAHPFVAPLLSVALLCGLFGIFLAVSRKEDLWVVTASFFILYAIRFEWFLRPEYHGLAISLVYVFVVLLYTSVWTYLVRDFTQTERSFVFIAKAFLFELGMGYFLCGFTIDQTGVQALVFSPLSRAYALLGGVGVSVLILFVNTEVYFFFTQRPRWLLFVGAFACYFVGALYPLPLEKAAESTKAVLIQTGLKPEEKRRIPGKEDAFLSMRKQWDRLFSLVHDIESVDLIVFPEVTVPYFAFAPLYDANEATALLQQMSNPSKKVLLALSKPPFIIQKAYATNGYFFQAIAEKHQCAVVAGLCREEGDKTYSSALCFTPGAAPQIYDKRVLVPVAEAAPLEIFKHISKEYGISRYFTPGNGVQVFRYKNLTIQPSICYDEMLDRVLHKSSGVNLLLNLSNDAWYPYSTLPQRHFAMGIIRSIENGVTHLRSCNTGVTGGKIEGGEVVYKRELGEHEAGIVRVQFPIATRDTPYVRFGNYPMLFLCSIVILLDLFFQNRVSLSNVLVKLSPKKRKVPEEHKA